MFKVDVSTEDGVLFLGEKLAVLKVQQTLINEFSYMSKLIDVYDFLKMWTFYVETINVSTASQEDLPKTIVAVGEIPKEAPEKEFIAEKIDNAFNDEYDDEFKDEFESLDDIDFDQY